MFGRKPLLGVAAGLTAMLAVSARAGPPSVHFEYAPVVDVQPIVRVVQVERPRRECWQEEVYETVSTGPSHRPLGSAGPTIAGGILGGVIGYQFGGGSGQDAMTALGALIGAAIASDRARRHAGYHQANHELRPVTLERCQTTTERFAEERVEGYRVTYEYDGGTYTLRTREHPGATVKLRVQVSPVVHD